MIQYFQPKTKAVTKELQLSKFAWYANDAIVNIQTGGININVVMEKDGAKNSRSFKISNPVEWTEQAICNELLKLPAFAGSNPI